MKYTFEEIRKEERLLYEYTRGSRLFGLDTPESDLDTGGVYIGPNSWFLGLGEDYQENIQSEKNDDTWSEIKKYITQLSKSSPEALESLFVPDDLILYKNPVIDLILEKKESFLTKECFKPFANYALSQIKKSRGQNKAMMIDQKEVEKRKTPLEFCYIHVGHGSTWTLEKWLRENNLKEKYCGLVRLPNFCEGFALFYDWGLELKDIKEIPTITKDSLCYMNLLRNYVKFQWDLDPSGMTDTEIYFGYNKELNSEEPIGYRGILSKTDQETTQLRLSSIPKGKISLCNFQFGMNSYSQHCSDYKKYHDWVKNRNPERFDLNKGYTFDSKNICQCIRLLTQAIEVAAGEGLILNRRGKDREFLLEIKNHKVEYSEIIKYTESLEKKMKEVFEKSKLPDKPDKKFLENVLLIIRNEWKNKN